MGNSTTSASGIRCLGCNRFNEMLAYGFPGNCGLLVPCVVTACEKQVNGNSIVG